METEETIGREARRDDKWGVRGGHTVQLPTCPPTQGPGRQMSTEATTMLSRPARVSGVGSSGSGWWKQRPLLPRMQPVQNGGGYGHPGSQLWASGRAPGLVQRRVRPS